MSAYVHSSHATKSSWGSTNFQGFKQALIFHTWILNPNIPSYTFSQEVSDSWTLSQGYNSTKLIS